MRSFLLPSLNRAALRESQTTTRFTCGFSRSCNQAANVPSSKASDNVSVQALDELNKSVGLGLQYAFHEQIAVSIADRSRDSGLMYVHANILFLTLPLKE